MGDMLKRAARQVLTAGKADEPVADGDGVRPGHSIFTGHLLNALEGAAATSDGIVTANGVMAYVYDKVSNDDYSQQTPHFGYVLGDGDFVFDISLLETIQDKASKAEGRDPAKEGEVDILVNPAQELSSSPPSEQDALVNQLKDLLSDPAKAIRLDDFVALHVRRYLAATDQRHFPVQGDPVTKDAFNERVKRYDIAAADLQKIVILLARWARGDQLHILEKIFSRLAEADKGAAGFVVWIHLSWYPILVLIYSAGISALAARNYEALRIALTTPVHPEAGRSGNADPILIPAIDHESEIFDQFKFLAGHEKNHVPRSEYLFSILQPVLEDLLFLGRSYEDLFDNFEVMLALVYADLTDKDWGPIGRFGWKQRRSHGNSPFDKLATEATGLGPQWGPLKAGLFQGASSRVQVSVGHIRELLKHLRWF